MFAYSRQQFVPRCLCCLVVKVTDCCSARDFRWFGDGPRARKLIVVTLFGMLVLFGSLIAAPAAATDGRREPMPTLGISPATGTPTPITVAPERNAACDNNARHHAGCALVIAAAEARKRAAFASSSAVRSGKGLPAPTGTGANRRERRHRPFRRDCRRDDRSPHRHVLRSCCAPGWIVRVSGHVRGCDEATARRGLPAHRVGIESWNRDHAARLRFKLET